LAEFDNIHLGKIRIKPIGITDLDKDCAWGKEKHPDR